MGMMNTSLQTNARSRQGSRQRLRVVVDPMAEEGRGEREKGHRWAEALSGVEVLKVNQVSVELTPMFPPFKSFVRVM